MTLIQTSLEGGWQIPSGWHSLRVLLAITHHSSSHGSGYQMHYKPLQRSRQPGLGPVLSGALSTHTQELLLPQHCQNFRRTVETHLSSSSKFSSAANGAIPSIHSRTQRGRSNPAPGKDSCPNFYSLFLSG